MSKTSKDENTVKTPEEIQAEAEEIQAEAEEIETDQAIKDWNNRKVKIMLFKDDGAYKDDVTVGLNGRLWNIPRGVEVEVPVAVAEIVRNQEKQDVSTARLIQQMEAEYQESQK